MTAISLNKCKTLDDFNNFSQYVQTDPISDGRSFVYTDPKSGKQRSYTMNQIVYQFEKCMNESKMKSSLNDFYRKTDKGVSSIDQWNADANKRTNTCLLFLREWIGNLWFSFTHEGWDKDETLEKIRPVQIFIKCIDGKTKTFFVNLNVATGEDLSTMYCESEKMKQAPRLIFAGRNLRTNELLKDQKIQKEHTIQACATIRGD